MLVIIHVQLYYCEAQYLQSVCPQSDESEVWLRIGRSADVCTPPTHPVIPEIEQQRSQLSWTVSLLLSCLLHVLQKTKVTWRHIIQDWGHRAFLLYTPGKSSTARHRSALALCMQYTRDKVARRWAVVGFHCSSVPVHVQCAFFFHDLCACCMIGQNCLHRLHILHNLLQVNYSCWRAVLSFCPTTLHRLRVALWSQCGAFGRPKKSYHESALGQRSWWMSLTASSKAGQDAGYFVMSCASNQRGLCLAASNTIRIVPLLLLSAH